jgi:23S rRNA pseudouridine955/2504/2580 synthase
MKEIVVNKKYDGKKLNSFLLDNFDGLKLNTLYKALRKRDVRVNDTKVSDNVILHSGDVIKVFIPDEQLFKDKSFNIDIIYEDDNIVVVNKPAEIEVVGENSLTTELCKYYNSTSIFPCHRLDRNTTGLVLLAKNEKALNILLDKFKNREIEKHYRALVYGIPCKKEDTLTAYLFKDAKKSLVYISDIPKKGYEKIITSYKVISSNSKNNTSFLDVNLHTGKTHQIRAHLAHIGYPIVGDGKYGNREINKKFKYKYQQLCSYSLKFCFKTDAGILNYLNNKNVPMGTENIGTF